MKHRVKLFFSYCLFWLVFFFSGRLIFLIYYSELSADLDLSDILLSMAHGFRLDLSTMGYFMIIPGLILVVDSLIKPNIAKLSLNIYTIVILLISTFIVILDLEMYKHWSFRLDATPLLYIGQDTTVPIDNWGVIKLTLIYLIIFIAAILTYKRFIIPQLQNSGDTSWKAGLVILLLTACMIGPIRGTVGIAPINVGMVYFHPTKMFANHAAINVVWNTGYALKKMDRLKYPNNFLEAALADKYFSKLYHTSGETTNLLNTNKPNVVLIILESYTAGFVEALGGDPEVAPNLNRLVKEGVLFENFYSSGDRTDKGIVSILCGYPTQPTSSIIKHPKKTQKLPFLNKKFEAMGYNTGFTYGGNIDFANFRSFMSNAGFQQLTHSDAFPDSLNNSKWGVHDEFVFDKFYDELSEINKPFFKVMLTLSSHEPFEVPMETVFEGTDDLNKFKNSAHYTDEALGEFINKAKSADWWDNTLIVITADHGHKLPDNNGLTNPDRFKIPMLWLGGALAVKDSVIATYGNQTDIPNTLLGQISHPDERFIFSKDLLAPGDKNFSVFVFNNGYGYIEEDVLVVYDNVGKQFLKKEGVDDEELLLFGKAYMQKLYSDYNNK